MIVAINFTFALAVITAVPAPLIVTFPEEAFTTATRVLLLAYVIVPSVVFVKVFVKLPSVVFFTTSVFLKESEGVAFLIVKERVCVPVQVPCPMTLT